MREKLKLMARSTFTIRPASMRGGTVIYSDPCRCATVAIPYRCAAVPLTAGERSRRLFYTDEFDEKHRVW